MERRERREREMRERESALVDEEPETAQKILLYITCRVYRIPKAFRALFPLHRELFYLLWPFSFVLLNNI